jgi:molybdate-binding protein
VAKLPELMVRHAHANIDLQYMASIEVFQALERISCDCTGFHIPEGEIGTDIIPPLSALFKIAQIKNYSFGNTHARFDDGGCC